MLEGLPFVQGGLTLKFNKNPLIYNVSYFFGRLGASFGGINPPKPSVATGLGESLMKDLTTFILKGYKIGETKTTAQTTSDLLPKHQASQSSLKTSEVATLLHIIHVYTLERSSLCDVLTIHQSTLLLVQISS